MLENLRAELRANPRARVGIALIVAVIWFYAALLLRDARDQQQQQYRIAASHLARVQAVAAQKDWPARLAAATTLRADVESMLWRGTTLGLARATLQDWLDQHLRAAGVPRPVVRLGTGEGDAGAGLGGVADGTDAANGALRDVWRVRAKLTFDFTPGSLNALLLKLEQNRPRMVVEALRVSKDPVPRVEMDVVAFFQKPGDAVPPQSAAEGPK
jgi:hypothetical protein